MTKTKQETEFDYRVYRWGNDEAQSDTVRAFIIRTLKYGRNLDTYILLADEARRIFGDIKDEDILPGVVRGSGYMDGHPVISFRLPRDKPVPRPFRECGRKPDFRY